MKSDVHGRGLPREVRFDNDIYSLLAVAVYMLVALLLAVLGGYI